MISDWELIEFEYGFSYVKRKEGLLYRFHYDKFFELGSFKIIHDKVGSMKELFQHLSNQKGDVRENFLTILEDILDTKAEDEWVIGPYSSHEYLPKTHIETGLSLNLNEAYDFYDILYIAASQMLELYNELKDSFVNS